MTAPFEEVRAWLSKAYTDLIAAQVLIAYSTPVESSRNYLTDKAERR